MDYSEFYEVIIMPTPLGDFHHPDKLNDRNRFDDRYEEAIKCVRDGLPPKDACVYVWGVSDKTYKNWLRWALEDVEAGFDETESNLIKLMIGLAKEDANLHKRLSKRAIEMALDNNTQMLQFLLKTRYGYTEKTKQEVDVSVDDTPVKFEIVDMQPIDEDD